jgi:hypothetical protein
MITSSVMSGAVWHDPSNCICSTNRHHLSRDVPLVTGVREPHQGGLPPRCPQEMLVMDRNLSGNVMEGRIANLIRANLWSTFNHFPKCLEDSCVSIAAIGLGVLFLIPQADSENFRSPWDNERDFVLEAFLLSKYWK